MIAPLGHAAMKGLAWYQGESDVDTPGYADRLKALIAGWRTRFGAGLAVEVVQLANYGAVQLAPGASTWAALRDEQRR
ncbi:sialate O-acetylesterase, partial [Streptomyces acidiscabies]|uniref:sialate O-acetylesterase n=1 Tax=Streptomyces acidiscabies TaxID=42234 RepID=UPI0038F6B333